MPTTTGSPSSLDNGCVQQTKQISERSMIL